MFDIELLKQPFNPVTNCRLLKDALVQQRALGKPMETENPSLVQIRARISRDIRTAALKLLFTAGLILAASVTVKYFAGAALWQEKDEIIPTMRAVRPDAADGPDSQDRKVKIKLSEKHDEEAPTETVKLWITNTRALFAVLLKPRSQLVLQPAMYQYIEYTEELNEFFERYVIGGVEGASEEQKVTLAFLSADSKHKEDPNKKWFREHGLSFYDAPSRTIFVGNAIPNTVNLATAGSLMQYNAGVQIAIFPVHDAEFHMRKEAGKGDVFGDNKLRHPLVLGNIFPLVPDAVFGQTLGRGRISMRTVLAVLEEMTNESLIVFNERVWALDAQTSVRSDKIFIEAWMYQIARWLLARNQDPAIELARPFLLELVRNPSLIKLL